MPHLTIYTTSTCLFCRELREFLSGHRVSYLEYNVSEDPERLVEMRTMTRGASTVPVIVVDKGSPAQRVLIGYEPSVLGSILSSDIASSSAV